MSFLEKSTYFTPEQNGFRINRSTAKNLLNIKNEIQTALQNKQKWEIISFDIAKHTTQLGDSESSLSSTKFCSKVTC